MSRARWGGALAAALALAAPATAGARGLPTVSSGARPGPPVLYAPAPAAPELSVNAPFHAQPLLVSGTDAYRDGEYLYQDYLFDDRGADTAPGHGNRCCTLGDVASPTAGDVFYPTATRYAGNAADLVEFRVRPTATALVYRITLHSALEADTAVVGIGIDTDLSAGAPVAWPHGAGITSPGLDKFITAWGTGGEVTDLPGGTDTALAPGAVTMSVDSNQMTITVPRSVMDPGTSTWRYVAGVGLWNTATSAWKTPATGTSTSAETPASGGALPAPAVFNLAFRFDEPQTKMPTPPYTTFPGIGNWFEEKQAHVLAGGTSGDFHADVDFAQLANGPDGFDHPPGATQARIFASAQGVPEGVKDSFPEYGGTLQPYMLHIPPGYSASEPAPLTLALHPLGTNYTMFDVYSPNWYAQIGDERGSIVATPHGYGGDGWYIGPAEADVFEVWADVARHFALDPERTVTSGYSMGGYGSYRLPTAYPDLFAKALTVVGPPADGIWVPPGAPTGGQVTNTNLLLENVRWVPYLNWALVHDEEVPYAGVRAQLARFQALGLRAQLWSFGPDSGEHNLLAVEDSWQDASDFLDDAHVVHDPWRVNYAFLPEGDDAARGLVHDHAYWVSDLRARVATGDPANSPARGEIDARSLAFGRADPVTGAIMSAAPGPVPPGPHTIEGTEWTSEFDVPARNALDLRLTNVAAARIDGRRAHLDPAHDLTISLHSDGPGSVRLDLALPAGSTVDQIEGEPLADRAATGVAIDATGVTVAFDAGTRSYLIHPGPAMAAAATGAAAGPGVSTKPACRDRLKPRSRFLRRSASAARARRPVLRGRSSDLGCGPRGAGRVAKVRVALARKTGSKCRFLLPGRRSLGAPVRCTRRRYLHVRARTRWSLRVLGALPAGRYIAWVKAVDASGNRERLRPRGRVRFRVGSP